MEDFEDTDVPIDGIDDTDLPLDEDFNDMNVGDDFTGGGDSAIDKHQDLLKDLTDFDPAIKKLVNHWLGLTWNEQEGKFKENKFVNPVMNLQGATWCIGRLLTFIRPNNIITNIRSEEYKYIMQDFIHETWINVGSRAEEFGIQHDGDILRVCQEMQNYAELVLMGAGDGKYNNLLKETTHRSISETITPQQQNNRMDVIKPTKQKGVLGRAREVMFGGTE